MPFFEYMYYVALRYAQGENSLDSAPDLMTRINAMMTTGVAMLVALLTPAKMLSDLFGINNFVIHACKESGIKCGGLALPLMLAILLQVVVETYWLHPRLNTIKKRFWPFGRPNPLANAALSVFVGLAFFAPLVLTDSYPLLALFLWLACVVFATYSLGIFAVGRTST
jgi:hypothetical protein